MRPYTLPPSLTTATWQKWPIERLDIHELRPTQTGVHLIPLLWQRRTDPIFVVRQAGKYYIEDGHTRYARAVLTGETTIEARVYSY